MKIAFVSPYDFPYPGGVTEHIIALTNGLRRRGHEVHILAASSGYKGVTFPNIRAVTKTVSIIPVGRTIARVGLSPLSYIRIKKILRQENFDVIHLQEPLTPSITWLTLMQTQALAKTVTVGTFHAYHEQPHWIYSYGRPLFGKFFNKLDSLIAVSDAAYEFAYRMFPGDYQIIPNGIDLNRFGRAESKKPCSNNKKPTILFVGRLDWRKGFANLMKAFIQLKPEYPRLQLKVVGPFEAKDCATYKREAEDYQVDGVEFVGYVPPEELPDFYHQADIFCAPSLGCESFGIVLLEAMAAGLPVVASDIAGYRTVITDNKDGLLVPPGQPSLIADALRQLLNSPARRDEMGRYGRLKAGQYGWDFIINETLELYTNTIKRKQEIVCQNLDLTETAALRQRQVDNV